MNDYIKPLTDVLNEIGDAGSKPFKWKFDFKTKAGNQTYYEYIVSGNKLQYNVTIIEVLYTPDDIPSYEEGDEEAAGYTSNDNLNLTLHSIAFNAKLGNYDDITNAGELFPLMATIVEIVKHYVKENNPEFIQFYGVKGDKENIDDSVISKRDKLYGKFLDKNLKKVNPKAESYRRFHKFWILIPSKKRSIKELLKLLDFYDEMFDEMW